MTVCFFVLFAVDKDFAVFDLNGVSRKTDQSFDKELALIIRIFEDDDVVALRIFHFLGNMSSEEVKINAICHTETEDTLTGQDSDGIFALIRTTLFTTRTTTITMMNILM